MGSAGDDVWISSHAVILADVTIGDGAIVAAGTVVNRHIEADTVVAGNPAPVVRPSFDPRRLSILRCRLTTCTAGGSGRCPGRSSPRPTIRHSSATAGIR